LLLKRAQDANLITTGILSGAKYQGMHIELVGAAAVAVVAALAIVAKLTAQRQRSWLERDLQRGDLSFLTDFAFFRNRRPPSIVVDRLSISGENRARQLPDDPEGLDRYPSPAHFGEKLEITHH